MGPGVKIEPRLGRRRNELSHYADGALSPATEFPASQGAGYSGSPKGFRTYLSEIAEWLQFPLITVPA